MSIARNCFARSCFTQPFTRTKTDARKVRVVSRLTEMIVYRLFDAPRWLVDNESSVAISRELIDLDLFERVPGDPRAIRSTTLGQQMNVDLMSAFLGYSWEYELVENLQENGLIDGEERARLWREFDHAPDVEIVLRPVVQAAFMRYWRLTAREN
jgi:hypothetical protein